MDKLLLYGGTFSPPHKGHINALRCAINAIKPDITFVEPTFIPPHKSVDENDSPEHRLNMCRLAFEEFNEYGKTLFVDNWEILQGKKSFTLHTLEHFSTNFEITLLIGTDMLMTFQDWHKPENICKLCKIAFMRREYIDSEKEDKIQQQINFLENKYDAKIFTIEMPALEISSTKIRDQLKQGIKPEFIQNNVYKYIKKHNLYAINTNR